MGETNGQLALLIEDGKDKESRKKYFSMYAKGIQGNRRCKMIIDELERTGGTLITHPVDCEENIRYIKEVEAYKKELECRIQAYDDMCKQIVFSIKCMEGIYREVLTLRYIEGQAWDEIAEKMRYSVGNIHRIHNKAIERLALH